MCQVGYAHPYTPRLRLRRHGPGWSEGFGRVAPVARSANATSHVVGVTRRVAPTRAPNARWQIGGSPASRRHPRANALPSRRARVQECNSRGWAGGHHQRSMAGQGGGGFEFARGADAPRYPSGARVRERGALTLSYAGCYNQSEEQGYAALRVQVR